MVKIKSFLVVNIKCFLVVKVKQFLMHDGYVLVKIIFDG